MDGGASGGIRDIPTHMHMHAHACTHTLAHLYMYRNCKWPPTWRHPCLACLACLTCMCVHAYVRVHACLHAWDTPQHPHAHPIPIHPSTTPQGGEPPESLKI